MPTLQAFGLGEGALLDNIRYIKMAILILTLPLIASVGLALGTQLMDQAAEPAFAEFQLL